jgi:hypothetical protein
MMSRAFRLQTPCQSQMGARPKLRGSPDILVLRATPILINCNPRALIGYGDLLNLITPTLSDLFYRSELQQSVCEEADDRNCKNG